MIVYFSATGNSKYVARRIAKALDDRSVSIEKQDGNVRLADDEVFGIVTPVNWWELPVLTREYLEKLQLAYEGEPYTFLVTTYGTTPGCTFADAGKTLEGRGIRLTAGFSVKMPDNWTPVFDLSDSDKVARQNEAAEEYIDRVIEGIRERAAGNHMQRKLPYAVRFFTDKMLNSARRTERFYVEDSCSGCGLCARKCPVQAIRIRNRKPVWVSAQCALCLRCLHNCPTFAIQYGNGKTKKHGQYKNPNVK